MAAYSIYAQQLSELKHGLPLWDHAWQDGEVRIGDVGHVREDDLCRLFSAVVPLGHGSSRLLGVPNGHNRLMLNQTEIRRHNTYHPAGPLHTASLWNIEAGVTGGM